MARVICLRFFEEEMLEDSRLAISFTDFIDGFLSGGQAKRLSRPESRFIPVFAKQKHGTYFESIQKPNCWLLQVSKRDFFET